MISLNKFCCILGIVLICSITPINALELANIENNNVITLKTGTKENTYINQNINNLKKNNTTKNITINNNTTNNNTTINKSTSLLLKIILIILAITTIIVIISHIIILCAF